MSKMKTFDWGMNKGTNSNFKYISTNNSQKCDIDSFYYQIWMLATSAEVK